jgi:NAD(P)-dependent dehydrogenase (short-subunit alcohol dehydrogenase family)|tara:strand:+ start:8455 stop:9210 length:756 start_codon:yes stop_codon:yes gene_type:complete
MFDLTDKVAIVTGSTQGIGKAIARAYAQAGAKVVISSRKPEVCDAVAAEFAAEGLEALAIPCHVGDKAQLQRLVEKTLAAWGRIDILVCNAATNPVYGPSSQVSDEAFDKIIGTNLRSVFQLCNLVCPGMAEQGGGSIILISSIAGLRGNEVIGVYGLSKAAEAGLARNLAVEWGPKGIRANAIAPGLVKTEFARALWEDPVRLERAEHRTPLRRIGLPEDIAGVAVFLASKASAYVTGQTLVADGGETIS